MKKGLFIFIIFCIGCFSSLNAQNLVVNPSFEITTDCPISISQFELATGWDGANGTADTCSTSDLYATCSWALGGANSPNGLLGYQPSHSGNYHAGMIAYEGIALFGCLNFGGADYREYLQGSLTQPLVAGKTYCVSFYISLANSSKWGTDDIGVYFSNTSTQQNFCTGQGSIAVVPQLEYTGAPLLDTTNWVQLQWNYTATGGEQYFIIGNFKNDGNTSLTDANCGSLFSTVYYYVDDVKVEEVPVDYSAVQLLGDTLVCQGQPSVYTAQGGSEYLWSNGDTASTITAVFTTDTLLQVQISVACTTFTRSIFIQVKDCPLQVVASIDALNDTICPGKCTLLSVDVLGNGPFTYQWIQLSNAPDSIVQVCPTQQSTYTVIVDDTIASVLPDTVSITIYMQESCPYVIPNVISPNGDGANDVWEIQNIPLGTSVIIYNRWGFRVYDSDAYPNNFTAEGLTGGVYFYVVTFPLQSPQKGILHVFK